MYNFDVVKETKNCIQWVRDWFDENGSGCNAVIGISGGKDSTVTGKILVEALGKDRVIGVIMPNGVQEDIDVAYDVTYYLGIKRCEINILEPYTCILNSLESCLGFDGVSRQSIINLPPRLRMATLYAISQSMNGRVVNTCNYSEDYVGYSTIYGDSAGDFSPLGNFTVTEVKVIGRYLCIPDKFIDKIPSDGLCGKSDEDNLGFSYDVLDKYIREGIEPDREIKNLIDIKHKQNLFKMRTICKFEYNPYSK